MDDYTFGPVADGDVYGGNVDDYYFGGDEELFGDSNFLEELDQDTQSYVESDFFDSGDIDGFMDDFYSDPTPTAPEKEEKSWWDETTDWVGSREGITTLLGAGSKLFQYMNEKEKADYVRQQREQEIALKREDQKFKALIELAKLKYGPQRGGSSGGGGGGSSRRNELMIAALQRGSDDKVTALNALAKNYGSAVISGGR